MGPDCTDIYKNIYILFLKEQLPHVGFHFCFTSAVMSPGCHHEQGSPCSGRSIGVGGSWFLSSVRTTNQVIALT